MKINLLSKIPKKSYYEYECVIIGSGYGGSISAARLAKEFSSKGICLLERGKEFNLGDFPETSRQAIEEIKTRRRPLGLFDIENGIDMDVLKGNALGGTSNINAGVILEPEKEIFDESWPKEITYECLHPYFIKVRGILSPEKLFDSEDNPKLKDPSLEGSSLYGDETNLSRTDYQGKNYQNRLPLKKVTTMREIALKNNLTYKKAPIAVNYTQFDNEYNDYGVYQKKCNFCGNCVSGCNNQSKNTLTTNYLPLAKNKGVDIYTQTRVNYIKKASTNRYRFEVIADIITKEGFKIKKTQVVFFCNFLILSAGAIGSFKILERSRKYGFNFSELLGKGFSGNGDSYAAGLEKRNVKENLTSIGPTITSVIHHKDDSGNQFYFEEGALPSALQPLVSLLNLKNYSQIESAQNKVFIMLGMGNDESKGELTLHKNKLKISWKNSSNQTILKNALTLYQNVSNQFEQKLIENLRHISSIFESGKTPVTVHPLGGCRMANNVKLGVVNHYGKVFKKEGGHIDGMYILDASIIPTSLGANPLLTISALTERACEFIIRDIRNKS